MLMDWVGGVEFLDFNHLTVNKILVKSIIKVFTTSSILSSYSESNNS